jgi:hypothetical protein
VYIVPKVLGKYYSCSEKWFSSNVVPASSKSTEPYKDQQTHIHYTVYTNSNTRNAQSVVLLREECVLVFGGEIETKKLTLEFHQRAFMVRGT